MITILDKRKKTAYVTSPYKHACTVEPMIWLSFGSQMRNIKQNLESLWQITALRLNFKWYGLRGGRDNFA